MKGAKAFFYVCAGLFLLALSYHLGARNAQAQVGGAQEVAILTGTLNYGETIPLPRYADGTEALESDCRWIASPHDITNFTTGVTISHCSAENRVVLAYLCGANNCTPTDPTFSRGTADYMIIATRIIGAVSTTRKTLGQLKQRFRDPAPTSR